MKQPMPAVRLSHGNHRRRDGFTLIEMLVVIAVCSILFAILIPAVQMSRESSRKAQCKNHLRQIALGIHLFLDAHGHFPPGHLGQPEDEEPYDSQQDQWSGHLGFLLPYVEQAALYHSLSDINWRINERIGPAWYARPNDWNQLSKQRIPLFQCPSDPVEQTSDIVLTVHDRVVQFGAYPSGHGVTNYLGCAGSDGGTKGADAARPGIFRSRNVCRVSEITDGLSNTLLAGEVLGNASLQNLSETTAKHSVMSGAVFSDHLQRHPSDDFLGPSQARIFRSRHTGVVNCALADGSVRGLSETTSEHILAALGGKADGKTTGDF